MIFSEQSSSSSALLSTTTNCRVRYSSCNRGSKTSKSRSSRLSANYIIIAARGSMWPLAHSTTLSSIKCRSNRQGRASISRTSPSSATHSSSSHSWYHQDARVARLTTSKIMHPQIQLIQATTTSRLRSATRVLSLSIRTTPTTSSTCKEAHTVQLMNSKRR